MNGISALIKRAQGTCSPFYNVRIQEVGSLQSGRGPPPAPAFGLPAAEL